MGWDTRWIRGDWIFEMDRWEGMRWEDIGGAELFFFLQPLFCAREARQLCSGEIFFAHHRVFRQVATRAAVTRLPLRFPKRASVCRALRGPYPIDILICQCPGGGRGLCMWILSRMYFCRARSVCRTPPWVRGGPGWKCGSWWVIRSHVSHRLPTLVLMFNSGGGWQDHSLLDVHLF